MSFQASASLHSRLNLTDDDKGRYLLHYLLRSRGICEENVLLIALMRLCHDSDQETALVDPEEWQRRLSEVMKSINVKLNALDYKVVQISHGLGKNIVTSRSRDAIEFCTTTSNNAQLRDIVLPSTNRFYAYIDVGAMEETKMATRFSPKEVEFVKFAIQQMGQAGFDIRQGELPTKSIVVQEVNRIRRLALGRSETAFTCWNKYTTFAVGANQLTQHKALNAQEIQDMIIRLCELKWFCRDEDGRTSLDLRCIAELEDALISTYGFLPCQNCQRLAIHGVMCLHDDNPHAIWHVDCYQYQITHQHADCPTCEKSLLTDGVYVI